MTHCRPCAVIAQLLENLIDVTDNVGNVLLLGDPDEKISARAARARVAGSKAAAAFCRLLTWGQIVVTLGRFRVDHCQYALDKKAAGINREIFDWNTGRLREKFVSTVEVVEL